MRYSWRTLSLANWNVNVNRWALNLVNRMILIVYCLTDTHNLSWCTLNLAMKKKTTTLRAPSNVPHTW